MRGKILAGFLIIIIAILSVGYYSYESLTRLVTTMENASRPNPKNNQLKEILLNLSNAESSVRAYTLTRNSDYLTPFYESATTIDEKIANLNAIITSDSLEMSWLDSLNYLITQKYWVMTDLIELKKDDSREKVLNKVLENIFKLNKSSAQLQNIERKNSEQSNSLPDILPIEIQGPDGETKDNLQGKRPNIFERLLGRSKRKKDSLIVVQKPLVDTVQDEEPQVAEVEPVPEPNNQSVASSKLEKEKRLESYRNELMEAVTRLREDEQNSNQEAVEQEMALFELDNSIMKEVRNLVSKFEARERLISEQRTSNAEMLTAETKQRIAWIAGGSLGVFSLLVIVIFRDLAVNSRNKKKLQEAKEYAEKLANVKEEFLSNMSHEIRTPINSILGFAHQLERTSLDTRQKTYIEVLKKSSDHLLALINDVLDYSKLESGMVSLEEIGFKPRQCVEEVYEALMPFAQSKNLNFECEFEEVPEVLIGDPVRLRQIIINLVNNAIKFTLKGSVIVKVTSELHGKKCVLNVRVIDTGIGIKKENLDSIFETFNQADNSTSREFGGTGLGLSICKKLVDAQNGKISVNSTVNKGSNFQFEIPYLLGSDEDLPEVKKIAEIKKGIVKNHKVMVVDDEPYNILLFRTMLENHGIQVVAVENPLEVEGILKSEEIDLILMDIQMPTLDGISLTQKLRKELEIKLPIIALTAATSPGEKSKCIEAGFDGFITKPVKESDLINNIASFIGWEEIEDNEIGDPQSLDLDNLFEMGNNDIDFVQNMLILFKTNFVQNLNEMKESASRKDWKNTSMKAHKMIPPCRHLGLSDIANLLKSIERIEENELEVTEVNDYVQEVNKRGADIIQIIDTELERLKVSKLPIENA